MSDAPSSPVATPAVIEARGLRKVFGRFTAVDDVSFDVRPGEIFGFLGPNGAGKSTTIRMLCGLLSSSSGTARVGGFDINREPDRVRERIGYMSQKFSLYPDLTVAENLAFFGGVYGLAGARLRDRMAAVTELAGLGGLDREMTGALSGAHRQRLALACAVLHEPPILFLDEPTSGIDPISRRLFWDLVQGLSAGGVTVLITTHFMDEAEFCHRIGFISAGRLRALAPPAELKRDAVREDVFEVEPFSFRGAREAAAAVPGVRATAFFGARIHVFCERGAHDADSLGRALRAAGLEPRSVAPTPVSLEDAFLRLAGPPAEATPS